MRHGFSLVELSIVLVILGLLTGGILAGQSLIRAAELRAVVTEYNRYYTAQQTFRDKYFALPGDMTNATAFWGDDNTNCPDAAVANGTPGTCNGNGDGLIAWAAGGGLTGEAYQYWKQLALAGLIEGSYTGISTGCYYCGTIGVSFPPSKLASSTGWTIANIGTLGPGHPQWFEGTYINPLYFGTASGYTSAQAIKAEEAWNIDTKLDDGKPATGKVRSWNHSFHPNCTNTDTVASAVYTLTDSSIACALIFDTAS